VAFKVALSESLGSLVHRGVGGFGVERIRHQHFIAIHLALALVAFVALPVYLLINGRPGLADTLTFACALAPLAAVYYASRTGDLPTAQIIAIVALIAMGFTQSAGGPGISASTALWLALAPVAAMLAFSLPLIRISGGLALGGVALIAAAKSQGLLLNAEPVSQTVGVMTAAMAIIFACAIMYSAISIYELNRKTEAFEAARYRTLFDAMGDLVLYADRTGAVLPNGPDARAMPAGFAAIHPNGLNGRGLFERIHVADRPLFLKSCADAMDGGQTVTVSMRMRMSADGSDHAPVFGWIELRLRKLDQAALSSQAQSPDGLIMVLRDVTAVRAHAGELERAREQAEQASQWKDRFLANVSHELRTPLNAIIGFSEFLGDSAVATSDSAKRAEYANIIRESGEHLLSVVNTILDMSKIEAGSFEIFPEPFDLAPLIEQCCNMLSLKARENGVELRRNVVGVPAGASGEIVADKCAIKQIVINLLSNAVKFTPAGGSVSIEARREGTHFMIAVSDNGIGIAECDLARLGDPFFQARSTYDRPYEGTGLGLSVVRGLTGLHGGAIALESSHGAGTRVSIKLPAECKQDKVLGSSPAKIEAIPRVNRATGVMYEPQVATLTSAVKKIA